MIASPADAKREIETLDLPRVFSDIWSDNIPFPLAKDWQKPVRYFTIYKELLAKYPRLAVCVPLWESNRDRVFAFDLSTGEYVMCTYSNDVRCEIVARTYQQFAAAYLVECVYAGEEHLEQIATLLEFKYLESIQEFADLEDVGQDPDELKKRFLDTIPPGR